MRTKKRIDMDEKEKPLAEIISGTLYSDGEMVHSDLARLSDISSDDLALLKKALKSAELNRRSKMAERLAGLAEDDPTLDFSRIFLVLLDDPEAGLRAIALSGLELEDKHTVIRPMTRVLRTDESPEVREAAARALGKYSLMAECGELPEAAGPDIFAALIEVLENVAEPADIRRRALESIAPFQQEIVHNYIEDFYYSEDQAVKASALFAMGRNCHPRWLEFLEDEMRSASPEFRCEAARACGEIGDEEAVPGLIELTADSDNEVQEAAILALGKIGGREAEQVLKSLAKSHENRIREAAAAALAEFNICQDPLSSTS